MRWSTPLVAGLGGVLAVGIVPGATAQVDPPRTSPGVSPASVCTRAPAPHPVRRPQLVRHIATGETGWFSSPGLVDLNGDGRLEIVAPFYSTFVFDAKGHQLARRTATKGRVYAPSVVTDLEGDGVPDIVVGGTGSVAAYQFRHGRLRLKKGWPASVRSGGQTPEVRGLAAADLNHDGRVEVVATTTNTSPTGAQVFVFNAHGHLFQPKNGHDPAWPRYNRLKGRGNDLRFNKVGNHGYGAYGENVGIGNIDDDPALEIITTFDNHQINAFNDDGTSVLASKWFTNPESDALGRRMGWGQFIRWLDPRVEKRHYHRHSGRWPSPARQPWLQWTDSPPVVADLDGDGRNEVIGLPNVERHIPYRTQGYAFMALDGAYGDGHRSARRHRGFEHPKMSNHPVYRPTGDWYPPSGIPAPTLVDIAGDSRPEIVSALPGGKVYAVGPGGHRVCGHEVRTAEVEDVRLRGRRRRPEPGRQARAGLRHLLPAPERRTPGRPRPQRPASSRSPGCVTSVVTATASASRPLRRSATSPATARSRSCSRRSTTASTSTRCRARARAACPGPPVAATSSATGSAPSPRPDCDHQSAAVEERALRASRNHPGGQVTQCEAPSSTRRTPAMISAIPAIITLVSGSSKNTFDATAVRATPQAAQMP